MMSTILYKDIMGVLERMMGFGSHSHEGWYIII